MSVLFHTQFVHIKITMDMIILVVIEYMNNIIIFENTIIVNNDQEVKLINLRILFFKEI